MRWWDIPAVYSIEQDLFPTDAWTIDMFWSELAGIPSTREVIVAERSHDVVGYASLRMVGSEADINTIGVVKECQSHGIGRDMYRYLENVALANKAHEIYLEVRRDNEVANKFYVSEGFEAIDIRRNYYDSAIDAIVMRKKLP